MYNKCRCTYTLTKKSRRVLRQVTLSPLFFNRFIPLQLILPSYSIIDSYCQDKIELKRRCNCRSMICFRTQQRQMSTNDMLVNITNDVCSNHIHFNNVPC